MGRNHVTKKEFLEEAILELGLEQWMEMKKQDNPKGGIYSQV